MCRLGAKAQKNKRLYMRLRDDEKAWGKSSIKWSQG